MNGGAIAIGHPLGMSGARLTVTLLHELRRRDRPLRSRDHVRRRRPGTGALFERASAEQLPPARPAARQHVDGLVDAYYGPPELKEQVDAEEPIDAGAARRRRRRAARRARRRLAARPGAGCCDLRARPRRGRLSYSDEVEGCYGVRPGAHARVACTSEAHAELDELLPGDGSLLERRQAWRDRHLCPGDAGGRRRSATCCRCSARAPRALVDLPGRRGARRSSRSRRAVVGVQLLPRATCSSRVVLNTDVPTTGLDLLQLAAHEVYPGHHTEHAVKEQLLLRDQGQIEEAHPARADAAGRAQRGHRRGRAGGRPRRRRDARQAYAMHPPPRARARRSASWPSASRRRPSGSAPSASTPR